MMNGGGRMGRVGEGDSIGGWYMAIPIVTRSLLTVAVGLSFVVKFGIVNPYFLVFDYNSIVSKFQIWRLVTHLLFFGGFSFATFFCFLMMYNYSMMYEGSPYNTGAGSSTADYVWMLVISATFFNILAFAFKYMIMSRAFLFSIIYIWSRRNPESVRSFYGVITVKGLYIPWAIIMFEMLFGHDVIEPLLGIAVGHTYFFLVQILPDEFGKTVVYTPSFLKEMFSSPPAAPYNPYREENAQTTGMGGGYSWGRGRVLGND